MEDKSIKQCPHCGGVAYLNSHYSYKARRYFVFVKCEVCGSQGKIYSSQDEPKAVSWNNDACNNAIDAWNLRVKME